MATENIRQYTVSDPIVIQPVQVSTNVKDKVKSKWNIFSKQTAPSTAVTRPMTSINPQSNNTTGK